MSGTVRQHSACKTNSNHEKTDGGVQESRLTTGEKTTKGEIAYFDV